jgi:hypothetical protein
MTKTSPAAQGTVADWKLVPVNPTPEMMERYQRASVSEKRFDGAEVYRAMIAAAPASPSPEALPASGVAELRITPEELRSIAKYACWDKFEERYSSDPKKHPAWRAADLLAHQAARLEEWIARSEPWQRRAVAAETALTAAEAEKERLLRALDLALDSDRQSDIREAIAIRAAALSPKKEQTDV